MPTGYHVSRNNCQTFCLKLFSRIRVPTMKEEVLIGCNKIRRKSNKETMKNRWAHFIRFKILEAAAQTSHNLPPFRKLPLDLESAMDAALGVLLCVILFIAWRQLELQSFALLLLALFLGYLHGNHGTPHLLRPAHELAELEEEELDKAMEEIINELSPLNDALTESIMETYESSDLCQTWTLVKNQA